MADLDGRAIAFLATDGFEESELAGKVWRIGCMGHTARPRRGGRIGQS